MKKAKDKEKVMKNEQSAGKISRAPPLPWLHPKGVEPLCSNPHKALPQSAKCYKRLTRLHTFTQPTDED